MIENWNIKEYFYLRWKEWASSYVPLGAEIQRQGSLGQAMK
jgi:hypothetical protein